jgi:hypothetical protein
VDDPDDRAYARAPEPADVLRICRALNAAGARYLLIGGFAVMVHGAARFTKDIDLLIDDAPENVAAVKRGLAVLPDNAAAQIQDTDVRDHVVVRVADEIVIDLMGRACGLSYADAAGDAETILLEGVAVPVASKRTLIKTKDTIRPSDRADREFLQRRLDEEAR